MHLCIDVHLCTEARGHRSQNDHRSYKQHTSHATPPSQHTAAHRPILFSDNALEWSRRFRVTTWNYCSTCGLMSDITRIKAIDITRCPPTVVKPCKIECNYDCYRQRDLETQGIESSCGLASVWRRNQRKLWNLEWAPSAYPVDKSHAQPQREDWPVYDASSDTYVEWSIETAHLESMLELDEKTCL